MHALITVPIYQPGLDKLRTLPGLEIHHTNEHNTPTNPLPEQWLRQANYLFCDAPPANLAAMEQLELVQISSAGYTQIENIGLPQRGVRACNSTGVNDVPIAEWCVCMMVALARDLRRMIRNQEAGIWDQDRKFQTEIRGKTVGVWGYGGIGRETVRLAKAMGLKTHILTRSPVQVKTNNYHVPDTGDITGTLPDRVFTKDQVTPFLAGLDFLILAMPLTKANKSIVGEKELRTLPRHAYLLNPARGPLIQEQALRQALQEGWIAGAALDTHYHYPMPANHPLWGFPNVIMTPHISGSSLSPHTPRRTWEIFTHNVQCMMTGKPLINELPPEKLL